MIRWSRAKLDQIARRSIDANTHPIEAKLAIAGLLAADGEFERAESLVVAEFESYHSQQYIPEHLAVPFLEALIIVQRLDLAGQFLEKRHTPGCRVELAFNRPGSGEARLSINFALPECLKIGIDGSILTNDKTNVEVLWLDWIFPIFANYARNWPGVGGKVMFSNWDDALGAGLAMCSNRADCFLVPDNVFVPTRGYLDAKIDTKKLEIPWGERKPIAFWRGSTTGQPADRQIGWRSLPRLRLCELALEHPGLMDAGISQVIQISDPEASGVIQAAGLIRPYVPAREFNRYKYQIDIDGNTNAWPGLFQKLISGNPVLKVASPRGFRQWYYDRLIPWVNFVPIASDMNDLTDKIKWLQSHDDTARKIGERGQALALSMDDKSELARSNNVISAALHFFAHQAEIEYDFKLGSAGVDCLRDGWDGFLDDGGAIMSGHESALDLARPITADDFILTLSVSKAQERRAFRDQRLSIIVNGEILYQGDLSTPGPITVCITRKTIMSMDRLYIRILHPDAERAASQDSPLDERILSFVLHNLTLTALSAHPAWAGFSSFLSSGRHTTLGPAADQPPVREDLHSIVTHHDTFLYIDSEICEVRHGSGPQCPQNLYATVTDDTVFLHYSDDNGAWRPVRINPPRLPNAEPALVTISKSRPQGFAIVRVANNNAVGLASAGTLLCAEGHGRIALSRHLLSSWEMFRLVPIAH